MKGKNAAAAGVILLIAALCSAIAAWKVYDTPGSETIGLILLIVSGLGSVSLAVVFFVANRKFGRSVAAFARNLNAAHRDSMYEFPAPAFAVDDQGGVVWTNRLFDETVYNGTDAYGKTLYDLFETDIKEAFSENGGMVHLNEKFYRLKGLRRGGGKNVLSVFYLDDVTEKVELEFEYNQSRPTVMLVVIDNYEELLQNAKDSEKSHTVVEIEKLIENFIEPTTGVARKISSDRFMLVVEERHLSQMIKNRFPILDRAREIVVGERRCVTLSIGVGHCAGSLAESEKFARQALDMCLGRGGDQAAVKTENGFEFFGGVSNGVEKQTKVKTRIIASAVKELIASNGTVFIMGHKMGDMDSIGSATGLCAAVRSMGKPAYVVVEPEKNLAKQLISYISENEKGEFYITPTQALMKMDEESVLMIVDTHNPDFVDSYEVYKAAETVVVIDHHRRMVKAIDNAVIFFHEPQASSVSEMVAELIQYFGDDVKLTAPQAEALLSGIMLDTKNFVMRTGVRTFEAAAYLRLLGADTVSVKKLFSNTIDTYQQKSMLITNCEVYEGCAVATARATSASMRVAAPQAADELLGIDGVDASFVMYEEGGTVYVSARSMGRFNVQVIMEALGGGGHQTMAGAQLKSSLTAVKEEIFHSIDEYLINQERSDSKSRSLRRNRN